MKQLIHSLLTCALLASPAAAQVQEPGTSLMERGAQLFLKGILKEMEPALEDLSDLADGIGPAFREFAVEMGPKLREIFDQVEDWSVYQAPEMLPNGDIIVRRKPQISPENPTAPTPPAPQIEL